MCCRYDPFYGHTAEEAILMAKNMTQEQLMAGADHYMVRPQRAPPFFVKIR